MTAPEAGQLAPTWRRRFAFFDAFGLPGSTPMSKQAYRAMGFMERMTLTTNIWAFLFGFIYFYVKGMWRKGTALLGAGLAVAVLLAELDASAFVTQVFTFGFAAAYMTTANYAYYLHTKGSQSWNPFEGFGRRTA